MEYLLMSKEISSFKRLFDEQRKETGMLCARERDRNAFINLFRRHTHLYINFNNNLGLTKMEILTIAFDLALESNAQVSEVLGVSIGTVKKYHGRIRERLRCYSKKLCLVKISQAHIINIL